MGAMGGFIMEKKGVLTDLHMCISKTDYFPLSDSIGLCLLLVILLAPDILIDSLAIDGSSNLQLHDRN